MEWLYEELLSFFVEKGISFLQKIKLKKKIKRTSDIIREAVCQKYETEQYFLHLDDFIHTNKFVFNFITNCLSQDAVWNNESIKAYCNKRLDSFIEKYPEHLADRKRVSECLEFIVRIVINNICEIDDINVVNSINLIRKHIDDSVDVIKSEISEIYEKEELLADKFESIIFKNIENNVEYIPIVINDSFTPPELNEKYISYRDEYITYIKTKLNSYCWYHIVGSAWSGKTYVSLLLKQNYSNSIWLDISRANNPSIIGVLEKRVLNQTINRLDNIIIIIDNFPRLLISDPHSQKIVALIKKMISQGIKIVSFGCYENKDFISYSNVNGYYSDNIKDFSDDDTLTLMTAFGAPSSLLQNKASGFIKELCGKKPAAIIIILNYLKNDNWNISSDILTHLLKLDIEELNKQVDYILHETIKDRDTRDLLYRIAYIGFEIKKEEIEKIAQIEPKISLIGERLNELKGVWLTEEKLIKANGLLRNAANENLTTDMKKAISNIIADSILVNKKLDQIEISKLIVHLVSAERFDEAGQIYLIAIQNLYVDHVEYNDSFLFVKMWNETPLPNEMSASIKAGIRLYQIMYDAQNGVKNSFAIDDLKKISKDNDEIREIIVLSSGMIMMDSYEIALCLLEAINSFSVRSYINDKLFCELVLISVFKCQNTSDIKRWFKWIQKQLDVDLINQMDEPEYSYSFIHAFDIIRENIGSEDIPLMEELIDEIECYALEQHWKCLYIGCLIKKIHLYGLNKHDYEASKCFFNNCIEINKDNIVQAHLCYEMGLLAFDNKDYSFAEECFNISTSKLAYLGDFDKAFCLANCAITYSYNSKPDIAKIAIDQAVEKANSCDKTSLPEEMLYKLNFERVIAYYYTGDIYNAINSIEVIRDYLFKHELSGNEHIIAISLHCLAYILNDLIDHAPPKVTNVNEEYIVPYMGMLWSESDPQKFKFHNIELRNNSLFFVLALLFDYYGYNSKANTCIEYIRNKNGCNMINSQIVYMAMLKVYYIYKLWEICEYNYATELLVQIIKQLDAIQKPKLIINILLKCSFYLILHKDRIKCVLKSIKDNNLLSDNIYIKSFVNSFELTIEDCNYEEIMQRANNMVSDNKFFTAICYVIATEKANFSQLLTLYLCVFSAFENDIFSDVFWMNDVLIPLMRRQLSGDTEKIISLNDIINGHNSILNGYKYNANDIKRLLKQCVVLTDKDYCQQEWLNWLQ